VNFLITTTGVPTPTVSKAGSLPPGVTFTANSDGTARLEGTATKTGVFTPTIKAANSAGTASQTLRITVQ
jgi:hypothetical protein